MKIKISSQNWAKLGLELFVVFLGVSAGFILNNWRNYKEEQKLQMQYIESFSQDISANIGKLEESIDEDSLWLEVSMPVILLLQKDSLTYDSALAATKRILQMSQTTLQTGTFEDMKSSGNLNIISDYQLKSQLVEYHMSIAGISHLDSFFNEYFNDFVMPLIIEEYDLLKNEFRNPEIVKSLRFSNILTGYLSMVQQRKVAHANLLSESMGLQNTIKMKLGNSTEN